MKDLTQEITNVYSANDLESKRVAMLKLIENSHAKSSTKQDAIRKVVAMKSSLKLDQYATNFMLSGEGMKV